MHPLEKYIAKREEDQQPPPPPTSKRGRFLRKLLLLCASLAVFAIALIGMAAGRVAVQEIMKPRSTPIVENLIWNCYTVAGISIESPVGFDSGRDDLPSLPPDVQKITQRCETFRVVNTPEYLAIFVTVGVYKSTRNSDRAIKNARNSEGKEEITIVRGNTIWLIGVLYGDARYTDTAKRIVQSVKLIE